MKRVWASAVAFVLLVLFMPSALPAADWPQILGPNRNGAYEGNDLAPSWPKGGPKTLWKMDVGQGFAGPAVANGKVILFHRIGNNEVVQALDAESGQPLWKHEYPTTYRDDFGFDAGPRAVPTISDGKVFTYGADGRLTALSLADGKRLWDKDCKYFYKVPKSFFGQATSPLAIGGRVVLVLGGEVATIVAFESHTGRPQIQGLKDEASYSSPTTIRLMGHEYIVALTRSRLVFMNAKEGNQAESEFPFQPAVAASVTAAVPIVVSNQIFISASYGLGAVLLEQGKEVAEQQIEKASERPKPGQLPVIVDWYFGIDAKDLKVIWRNDTSLSCHYSTPVHRDGFLYGLHGRHDFPGGTELRCVEWATGEVRWSKPGLSGANVMLAGDSLLVLTEKGELIRAEARPDGYRELGRAQILGSDVRAYPALANGRFYARNDRHLVCIDLR